MAIYLERRQFLRVSAATIAASLLVRGEVPVSLPEKLDHILLGAASLEVGIAFVEHFTGVTAVPSGIHPGRGTWNALLSLGNRRYLEIIAPDPGQSSVNNPLVSSLRTTHEPRLVGWAAHPGNLADFAQKLRAAQIGLEGPTPGSRKRPDGKLLKWEIVSLADTASGLLPFFIEWSQDSVHPSVDAPKGCALLSFTAETPDPDKLAPTLKALGIDLLVKKGEQPRLHAVISGPKGNLDVYS